MLLKKAVIDPIGVKILPNPTERIDFSCVAGHFGQLGKHIGEPSGHYESVISPVSLDNKIVS